MIDRECDMVDDDGRGQVIRKFTIEKRSLQIHFVHFIDWKIECELI